MIRALVIRKSQFDIKLFAYSHKIELAAVAPLAKYALETYKMAENVDVVLMDANWPDKYSITGKELISQLLNHNAEAKIIVMTTNYEKHTSKAMEALGAKGYFYEDGISPEEIKKCIREVHEGRTYFCKP